MKGAIAEEGSGFWAVGAAQRSVKAQESISPTTEYCLCIPGLSTGGSFGRVLSLETQDLQQSLRPS